MLMGSKRHYDVIRETLSFPDLETMAVYFTSGPGRPEWGYCLAHVKFYVYKAFKLLYANLRCMPLLQRLQVVADDFPNGMLVETPGMWSLLKDLQDRAIVTKRRLRRRKAYNTRYGTT
ncbi:hypothetical protein V8E51_020029 [Hyaloscypha variabilis]